MRAGLLFDATLCVGCGACAQACKDRHGLPPPIDDQLTSRTLTTVLPVSGTFVRKLCMHCLSPTCASVCPVGALYRSAEGVVAYDADRCIGCRYCIQACPFRVPKFEWEKRAPLVVKCDLCLDEVRQGRPTACAAVCPTGATMFGDRDALLAEAHARIARGGYVDHVYGEEEAGGTAILALSAVPFGKLGLATDLPRQSLPLLTWNALSRTPDVVVLVAAALWGVHWITKRREEVRFAEQGAGEPRQLP